MNRTVVAQFLIQVLIAPYYRAVVAVTEPTVHNDEILDFPCVLPKEKAKKGFQFCRDLVLMGRFHPHGGRDYLMIYFLTCGF